MTTQFIRPLEFRGHFVKLSYQTLAKLRRLADGDSHAVSSLGAWIYALEAEGLVTIKDGWVTATEFALKSYHAQIA